MPKSVYNGGKKVPQTPQTLSYFGELISIITDGIFLIQTIKIFSQPSASVKFICVCSFLCLTNIFHIFLCSQLTYEVSLKRLHISVHDKQTPKNNKKHSTGLI